MIRVFRHNFQLCPYSFCLRLPALRHMHDIPEESGGVREDVQGAVVETGSDEPMIFFPRSEVFVGVQSSRNYR